MAPWAFTAALRRVLDGVWRGRHWGGECLSAGASAQLRRRLELRCGKAERRAWPDGRGDCLVWSGGESGAGGRGGRVQPGVLRGTMRGVFCWRKARVYARNGRDGGMGGAGIALARVLFHVKRQGHFAGATDDGG